mmetsp:Transcript_23027/g.53241  ORF Transcript_23027/g.53241 Transcript_23027/m.53241 type:complete len:223 (-) Transcript_23027:197-865(-)
MTTAKLHCNGSSGTRTATWPLANEPRAEPATSGATALTTTLPSWWCVPIATKDGGTIAASVVPRTHANGISVRRQSAGVITTPPPMPNMPEAKPATKPTPMSLSNSALRDDGVGAAGAVAVSAAATGSTSAPPASPCFCCRTRRPLSGTIGETTIWNTANARDICAALKSDVALAPSRAVRSAVTAMAPAAGRSTAPAVPYDRQPAAPVPATAAELVPVAWC